MTTRFIKITSTPTGEAPLHIREKWMGLLLPLEEAPQPREAEAKGVLTPDTTTGRFFSVNTKDALIILCAKDEAACRWWVTNTPHLLRKVLGFAPECCELVILTDEISEIHALNVLMDAYLEGYPKLIDFLLDLIPPPTQSNDPTQAA